MSPVKTLLKERTVKRAKNYKLGLDEIDDALEFMFGKEDIDEETEESHGVDDDVKRCNWGWRR